MKTNKDKVVEKGRRLTDIETLLILMRDDKSYSIAQLAGFIEEAIKARPLYSAVEEVSDLWIECHMDDATHSIVPYAQRYMMQGPIHVKKLPRPTVSEEDISEIITREYYGHTDPGPSESIEWIEDSAKAVLELLNR